MEQQKKTTAFSMRFVNKDQNLILIIWFNKIKSIQSIHWITRKEIRFYLKLQFVSAFCSFSCNLLDLQKLFSCYDPFIIVSLLYTSLSFNVLLLLRNVKTIQVIFTCVAITINVTNQL